VALSAVHDMLRSDLEQVDRRLRQRTVNSYEFVDMAVRHVIEGGGKRLRPMLALLAAQACGYEDDARFDLAAAMELIHVASLVHDDVIDEADMRRNRETLNVRFGNKVSVLVGDYMHARVLAILVACGATEPIYRAVADATQSMCEGEVIHAYKADDFDITVEDYLNIMDLKTARLISCSCRVGALLAGADDDMVDAMGVYGSALGVAFQIVDDVLDLTGEQTTFGKPTRNDLREGKLTLPVMHARDNCSDADRETLRGFLFADERSAEDVDWIVALTQEHDGVGHAMALARKMSTQACDAVALAPASGARDGLLTLAASLVEREN
jgi:octaprenyl-diphosphate synthase